MLDLHACVHLDEKEVLAVGVVEELDGAGVDVLQVAHQVESGLVQARTHCVGQHVARALFDDLLVAPLDRAIALTQVQRVAGVVAKNLHFDMTCVGDEAFHVERPVAERRAGLARCALERGFDVGRVVGHEHAAPAAT